MTPTTHPCRTVPDLTLAGTPRQPSPRYSIGTWDADLEAYTDQDGLSQSDNLTLWGMRVQIRELRRMNYTAHRRGNVYDGHHDNDASVLIERIDDL